MVNVRLHLDTGYKNTLRKLVARRELLLDQCSEDNQHLSERSKRKIVLEIAEINMMLANFGAQIFNEIEGLEYQQVSGNSTIH